MEKEANLKEKSSESINIPKSVNVQDVYREIHYLPKGGIIISSKINECNESVYLVFEVGGVKKESDFYISDLKDEGINL